MLDDFETTQELLTALRACLPFEVRLTPALLSHLRSRAESATMAERQLVREVSYLGDEGGIVCHLDGGGGREVVIASLTHLQVPAAVPVAAAVARYQKHRIKRLRKLGRA